MNKIKLILKEQGRSQIWLADRLGLSTVTITNYCNNKNQPKMETLYEIAGLLDVDVKDLIVSSKKADAK